MPPLPAALSPLSLYSLSCRRRRSRVNPHKLMIRPPSVQRNRQLARRTSPGALCAGATCPRALCACDALSRGCGARERGRRALGRSAACRAGELRRWHRPSRTAASSQHAPDAHAAPRAIRTSDVAQHVRHRRRVRRPDVISCIHADHRYARCETGACRP